MTAAKTTSRTYAELNAELQAVIAWFEADSFDVDQAVKQYGRGLELVRQLEQQLGAAANSVQELKAKFNAAAK
jgi:exodeoxyribonuclease VII small subunit